MAKLKFLIIIMLGSCFYKATAQHCNTTYLGTKTLYTEPGKKLSNPPNGYKPVFINHVGRHGARHLTKEVSSSYAYMLLNKADSLHVLTVDGEKLRQIVLRLNKVEHGVVKSISIEGRDELKGLGERLYVNYTPLFKALVNLNVAITKEIRTKQSADAFLSGLKSHLKDSAIIKERNDDTDLRFYDLSPAYTAFEEKGPWQSQFDSLQKELHVETIQQHLVDRWFKPAFVQQLKYAQVDKLVSDIFGFEAITYSVANEAKAAGYKKDELDFSSLFTCEELNVLGQIDNADGFYKKGPGLNNNGIQVRIAAPLLADFINTTDKFIQRHPVTAELRFAHAETIAPFAALLDMATASKTAAKPTAIDQDWKAGEVIPLSANIQWVIYSNAKGAYLIKFLLNEREVKINGLKPVHGNYYSWNNARKYYLNKLTTLGASLNGDMNRYLSDLK